MSNAAALAILFLFLTLYYKVTLHLLIHENSKLTDQKAKLWRRVERYRRFIRDKSEDDEVVTTMKIRKIDRGK